MLIQGNQALEFLLSEANGERSRDVVVITGGDYKAGTVLAKVTASGKYTEHDPGGAGGIETAAAVLGYDVDALAADHTGVVFVRDCEVSDEVLVFIGAIAGGDRADAITSLATSGIIAR